MQWTSQQIESFPRRELHHRLFTRASVDIDNIDIGRKCQRSIQGWRRFVAPHTPSESDRVGRGIPPDDITDLVTLLLAQTTEKISVNHPLVVPHLKYLVDLWPTIWIWIQMLHARHNVIRKTFSLLSARRSLAERNNYEVLIQALFCFLGYDSHREYSMNELTNLVKGTDGVLSMIATSWIAEGSDKEAFMGTPAGRLYSISSSNTRQEVEQLIITGCGGNAEKMADIAFRRITRNLHRPREQPALSDREGLMVYQYLVQDLLLYVETRSDEPSSALRDAVRTNHGCVPFFVDVMFRLLAPPHLPLRLAPLVSAMDALTRHIDEFQTYAGIRALLDTPFLDVITRFTTKLATFSARDQVAVDRFNECCNYTIYNIRRFSFYRGPLSIVLRELEVISAFVAGRYGSTAIATSLRDLQSQISPLGDTYRDFSSGAPPTFCCGNRQCESTTAEGTLYRCSGCKIVLYCSERCQTRSWRVEHRVLCKTMQKASQALLHFSSPDFRWLAHLIVRDFLKEPRFAPAQTDAASCFRSILMINYCAVERPAKGVVHLFGVTDAEQLPVIPKGSLREAWQKSLSPREPRRGGPRPSETVPILAIFPHQVGKISTNITALLTYPVRQVVRAKDVHVTWIYHHCGP